MNVAVHMNVAAADSLMLIQPASLKGSSQGEFLLNGNPAK